MLGHVELGTTGIYIQVSIKKLKEIHTLTHPAKARRTKTIELVDEPEVTEDSPYSVLAAEETMEEK